MNVCRKKIRVEVVFKRDKPASFSTKIEFMDENSRCYSISVSGTADNCLLTNYSYLQRMSNEITITANENSPIIIYEKNNDDVESNNNMS